MALPFSVIVALMIVKTVPVYRLDKSDHPIERRTLLEPVAEAIALVSERQKFFSRDEAAALLVSLAETESGLARYVVEGRCMEGPPGEQCDAHRGVPRARGVFQLHQKACPSAWELPEGSKESIEAETWCAVRRLAYAYRMCRSVSGPPWIGVYPFYRRGACVGSRGEVFAANIPRRVQVLRSITKE